MYTTTILETLMPVLSIRQSVSVEFGHLCPLVNGERKTPGRILADLEKADVTAYEAAMYAAARAQVLEGELPFATWLLYSTLPISNLVKAGVVDSVLDFAKLYASIAYAKIDRVSRVRPVFGKHLYPAPAAHRVALRNEFSNALQAFAKDLGIYREKLIKIFMAEAYNHPTWGMSKDYTKLFVCKDYFDHWLIRTPLPTEYLRAYESVSIAR